jgi:hypothetical protein
MYHVLKSLPISSKIHNSIKTISLSLFRLCVLFTFILQSSYSYSQDKIENKVIPSSVNPQNLFYQGKIENGDSLIEGFIRFDFSSNQIIYCDKESNSKIFNAGQVQSFTVFDYVKEKYRSFYSLPYKDKTFSGNMIFEILYNKDGVILLSREKYEPWLFKDKFFYMTHFNFFTLKKGEKIRPVSEKFKERIDKNS